MKKITSESRFIEVGDKVVDQEKFYTPQETEGILGLKRRAIEYRVRDGLLTRVGSPRAAFYKGEDIIRYLENGRR